MVKNKWVGNVLMIVGLMLALFILFSTYECIKDSYSFSDEENALYLSFSRSVYLIGNVFIYMALFLGHFEK